MFLRKTGFPEEGELALCTVSKIQPHCVFARLDEYENKSGMIHISEISPGRIRNIRDYVKEGKVVVCVVLRINRERGYIDLSLRRVSDMQRRNKVNEIKQQQKSEKIIEHVAKGLKIDIKKAYFDITEPILKEYPTIFSCFEDVVAEDCTLEEVGIPKAYIKSLEETIKQRIKPVIIAISGKLKLSSHKGDGIEVVKQGLRKAEEVNKEEIAIRYLGAGIYGITVNGEDYKEAEKTLGKVLKVVEKFMKKNDSTMEFNRDDE